MLWLGLAFPRFPLEVLLRGAEAPGPLAVATSGNRPEILLANAEAHALGIRAGMPVSAAFALAPGLKVFPRDEAQEAQALSGIALWGFQFTPTVSLAQPCGVLLEIGGSLKLFGGLDALLRKARAGVAALGYDAVMAVAPTPSAAMLFARAGLEVALATREELASRVPSLALGLLDFPEEALAALHAMGIRTVGDCLRLPRDGLARRFGQGLLDEFDRVLGALPDPRKPFVPPERHEGNLSMPAPVREAEALLFGAKRLFLELAGLLACRNAGATRLRLDLAHGNRSPTRVTLGLSVPSRDPAHLTALLRERLSRVALPAPVEEIGLVLEETAQLAPRNFSWLPDGEAARENRAELVERLRARLGEKAVHGLGLFPDHRPELAWREIHPRSGAPPPSKGKGVLPERPLWLLPRPRPLSARNALPWLDGPMELLAGPERIESGWWDGGDVSRDYFMARDFRGSRFWVFRERREERTWFLHGIFA